MTHPVFRPEMQMLVKQQNVSSSSKLHNLSPFLQDGIIRVGGRVSNSSLPVDVKHAKAALSDV